MAIPPHSLQKWALFAGLVLMTVWGVNFVVTKVVLADLGVAPFLFLRFLLMPLFGFALSWSVAPPPSLPRRGACRAVAAASSATRRTSASSCGHQPLDTVLLVAGAHLSPLFTLLIWRCSAPSACTGSR
jgi:drug/metabolite transporter (DMT)-like permease